MDESKLKWGIVGTGSIAHQFVQDLLLLEDHEFAGVASRALSRAQDFGQTYGDPLCFGSYEEMFAHEGIDIVYIATPHHDHVRSSVGAMEAGKHVLCEKPVAVNSAELQQMIQASQRHQVFFMEALWTRFNPTILAMLELVEEGRIGEVNYVNADFTFFIEPSRQERLMNPQLAGGSLLEMGVYPVFLVYLLFGKPLAIHATAHLHENGCDWQTTASMKFETGIAQVMSGFCSQSDMKAKIYGTHGAIVLDANWHETQGFHLITRGENAEEKHLTFSTLGKGFTYEAIACKDAIDTGKTEHPLWSHQHSLDLMCLLDEIREKAGIAYPFERV